MSINIYLAWSVFPQKQMKRQYLPLAWYLIFEKRTIAPAGCRDYGREMQAAVNKIDQFGQNIANRAKEAQKIAQHGTEAVNQAIISM